MKISFEIRVQIIKLISMFEKIIYILTTHFRDKIYQLIPSHNQK